ncbi:MAG TPA: carboxyl transferase domain-containing protein, partial [Terriglobales bacterium]|nr:carboxyl transferase domain-containing protein [Terriglobales bacterium]
MADRNDPTPPTASPVIESRVDPTTARFEANMRFLADLVSQVRNEEELIREGGGAKAIESQHNKGRLTARERINLLVDPGSFFELSAYAAFGMYEEWGGAAAAGVITGLARV